MNTRAAVAAGFLAFAFMQPHAVGAAEIKMLVSNALKTSMEELAPQFESASEHKLDITYGAGTELKVDIEKGAKFDVAIIAPAQIDALIAQGKLSSADRRDIAKAGFGLAARKGAPKPDISTVEGFKRALQAAKSIAYVEAGAGSPYFKSLLEKFGIAAETKPKLRPQPTSNPTAKAVANGEAEIGVTAISEILPYAGAQVVGPLPEEIQFYSVTVAAIATDTKVPDAARAIIRFLTTPAATAVFTAKGLTPG
jgi:molybdate transport system substrate-binding protein